MTGIIFLELIVNAVVFTFIFWALTFVAKFTYSNKFYNYKLNFYECGFKNFSKKTITFDVNFILLILFILIYDGEFFVLLPFALNIAVVSFQVICVMFLFFLWLVITLFFDFSYRGLEWQVAVCSTTFLIKKPLHLLPIWESNNLFFFYSYSSSFYLTPGKYIFWTYLHSQPYSKLKIIVMTSTFFIEFINYNFFMILVSLTYVSKLLIRKTANSSYASVVNKFTITPSLTSRYKVLYFYFTQLVLLYTWKSPMSEFSVSHFTTVSVTLFVVMSVALLKVCTLFKISSSEKISIIKSSILLLMGLLLFSLVHNFLTLLFATELISIVYFFFFINPEDQKSLTSIRYKNFVSVYIWNSFFLMLLFSIFIFIVSYTAGSLNFEEINIVSDYLPNYSYILLIVLVGWKAGAPGFHFLKFELYTYLSSITTIIFSSYTMFVNFFILGFIIVMFKSLLIANITFFLVYLLIINIIILYRGSGTSNMYTFLALSSANTWGTIFFFGLIKCYNKNFFPIVIQLNQLCDCEKPRH